MSPIAPPNNIAFVLLISVIVCPKRAIGISPYTSNGSQLVYLYAILITIQDLNLTPSIVFHKSKWAVAAQKMFKRNQLQILRKLTTTKDKKILCIQLNTDQETAHIEWIAILFSVFQIAKMMSNMKILC